MYVKTDFITPDKNYYSTILHCQLHTRKRHRYNHNLFNLLTINHLLTLIFQK